MQVSVLVPTRNEAGNIAVLMSRLEPVLVRLGGEVLFVDDSDETPSLIAAARHTAAAPVRLLHRAPAERFGGAVGHEDCRQQFQIAESSGYFGCPAR